MRNNAEKLKREQIKNKKEMEDIYLKDIKHEYHPNERVCDWDYVAITDHVRMYYKLNDSEGNGFDFYTFEVTGWVNEIWDENRSEGECVINGVAFFDGVRHLNYGDEKTDNFGYHYYANLPMIIKTIEKLREFEIKYCRDFDG